MVPVAVCAFSARLRQIKARNAVMRPRRSLLMSSSPTKGRSNSDLFYSITITLNRAVCQTSTLSVGPLMVKIFMRRGCSTGVGRQGVLDSGCHVADPAQAEQGRGRAARCSFLDGCVLHDNALGTG